MIFERIGFRLSVNLTAIELHSNRPRSMTPPALRFGYAVAISHPMDELRNILACCRGLYDPEFLELLENFLNQEEDEAP